MIRRWTGPGVLFVFVVATVVGCASASRDTAGRNPADSRAGGLAAFAYVHDVAVHSNRCVNCHVSGDRPMQLDGDARRFHPMNVQRKLVNLGYQCTSCHGTANFEQEHLPPGSTLHGQPHWAMPEARKSFDSSTSARRLCELWKDPKANRFENDDPDTGHRRNDPRTPEEMLAHVATDPLVQWTWHPGPGRQPSSGTHDEFVRQFAIWVSAGEPCPTEEP